MFKIQMRRLRELTMISRVLLLDLEDNSKQKEIYWINEIDKWESCYLRNKRWSEPASMLIQTLETES